MRPGLVRRLGCALVLSGLGLLAVRAGAQTGPAPAAATAPAGAAGGGRGGFTPPPSGLTPTQAGIDYAPADPVGTNGHKLDLYLPAGATRPTPVVLWSAGSAWRQDNGRSQAGILAAQLNPLGYAVVGVSVRSSSQAKFPAQVYDIKAAIRFLRANAARFNLDPGHVAVMGDSSGGWTAAMAAVTGDAPEMEGDVGTRGPSSAVQAAIVFYPPTNFSAMDAWALSRCNPAETRDVAGFCHDAAGSPESTLIGCALQTCPDKVLAASPMRYISDRDPPIMILHGQSDQLVPHNQGEQFYMALNKACHEASFISLPRAQHGGWYNFVSSDSLREGAVMRSTSAQGCTVTNPAPYVPTWKTLTDFLDRYLK